MFVRCVCRRPICSGRESTRVGMCQHISPGYNRRTVSRGTFFLSLFYTCIFFFFSSKARSMSTAIRDVYVQRPHMHFWHSFVCRSLHKICSLLCSSLYAQCAHAFFSGTRCGHLCMFFLFPSKIGEVMGKLILGCVGHNRINACDCTHHYCYTKEVTHRGRPPVMCAVCRYCNSQRQEGS